MAPETPATYGATEADRRRLPVGRQVRRWRTECGLTLAAWPMQLRFTPWQLVSGTDVIVNVAVGAPLGFFLAGAVRSDGRCSGTVAMIAATGMAAVLATTVELFQVLSAFRQSSWNDVLAQSLGAGIGAAGWMAFGPRVILWWRHLACEREPSIFAARLLQLYLPFYLLVQLTPFEAIEPSSCRRFSRVRSCWCLPPSQPSSPATLCSACR